MKKGLVIHSLANRKEVEAKMSEYLKMLVGRGFWCEYYSGKLGTCEANLYKRGRGEYILIVADYESCLVKRLIP